MKSYQWTVLVCAAFVGGWGLGEFRGRSAGASDQAAPAVPLRGEREPRAVKREERGISVASWAEKLGGQPQEQMADLAREIPPDRLGLVLETWLASHGIGGLDAAASAKFHALLDDWALRDADAAIGWADSLGDAAMRELALKGIAGALAETDPQRAFEVLVANGEFALAIHDPRLGNLLSALSSEAAAGGPSALKALWERLPLAKDSVTSFHNVAFQLGPDADFAGFADCLMELSEGGRRPIMPSGSGLMEQWAKHDVDEATRHVLSRALEKHAQGQWSDLRYGISKSQGAQAGSQWVVEALRQVPEEDLPRLFGHIDYTHSPGQLFSIDPGSFGPGERETYATGMIQAMADQGSRFAQIVLKEIEPARQLEVLADVRGMKDTSLLGRFLESQGHAAEDVARIIAAVSRPAD